MGGCLQKSKQPGRFKQEDEKQSETNENYEKKILALIYNDLASRISDNVMNKQNFFLFFEKNGYWGEKLFQQFSTKPNKLSLSMDCFINGMSNIYDNAVRIYKTTSEQKIHMLYNFFSGEICEEDEGISFRKFLEMLYNYPKADLKNILDDSEFFTGQLRQHIKTMDTSQRISSKSFKALNFEDMNFKIDDTQTRTSVRLESKVGSNILTLLNKQLNDRYTTVKINVQNRQISIQTVSVHALVKKLAKFVFKEAGLNYKTDKLKFKEFREWLVKHPMLYDNYFKSFHSDIWEYDLKGKKPAFTLSNFEKTSQAVIELDKIIIDVVVHLSHSILLVCEEKWPNDPIMILCLEGLMIQKTCKQSLGVGFEVTHRNGIYRKKTIYFHSSEVTAQWENYFKFFKGNTISEYYEIGRKIGIGKFSSVHQCKEKATGKLYAVKIIQNFKLKDQQKDLISHESEIMKVIQHPLLIQLKEKIQTKTHTYLVTELIDGIQLFDLVREYRYLYEPQCAFIISQIICGVRELHSGGILHRDLTPNNVMVEYDEQKGTIEKVCIVDFGYANRIQELKRMNEETLLVGTPNFIPPEVIEEQEVSEKVDAFAIGSLLYFLLSGNLPFDGPDWTDTLQKTIAGSYDMTGKRWEKVSRPAKDLIEKLLEVNPDERIGLDEAMRHPWLHQWPQLEDQCLKKKITRKRKHSKHLIEFY